MASPYPVTSTSENVAPLPSAAASKSTDVFPSTLSKVLVSLGGPSPSQVSS